MSAKSSEAVDDQSQAVSNSSPNMDAQSARTLLAKVGETKIFAQYTSTPWKVGVDAFTIPAGPKFDLSGGLASRVRDELGAKLWSKLEGTIKRQTAAAEAKFGPTNPIVVNLPDQLVRKSDVPAVIFIATAFEGGTASPTNAAKAAAQVSKLSGKHNIRRLGISLLGSGAGGLSSSEVLASMLDALVQSQIPPSVEEIVLTTLSKATYELAERGGLRPASTRPSLVPLHMDEPAKFDLLGRRPFAAALARRLRRIERERPEDASDSAFMMHIHAPWGAGKTTVLNFLREELQEQSDSEDARWIVVDFNAWQHQRLEPPWWALMDSMYRQAIAQLRKFGDKTNQSQRHLTRKDGDHSPNIFGVYAHDVNSMVDAVPKWLWISIKEYLWRLLAGRGHIIIAAVLFLWIVIYTAHLTDFLTGTIMEISGVVAFFATIWAGMLAFSRTLVGGSTRAAQGFMDWTHDPMRRVSDHSKDLLTWIDRPVIVFVDDVDRCNESYLVSLLEGIQTLFRVPGLMFVFAGDQRWINACFQKTYAQFAKDVKEPGRQLGTLFLEKAFQISVALPGMSDDQKRRYWNHLIRRNENTNHVVLVTAREEARRVFSEAKGENEILSEIRKFSEGSKEEGAEQESERAIREQIYREEAVIRMAEEDIEESTQHFLEDFAPLLEANPRSLKRLVNAYSILRDVALLSDIDVESNDRRRRQLALFTIVSMRWPILTEELVNKPEFAELIANGDKRDNGELCEKLKKTFPVSEIDLIRRVFRGDNEMPSLDSEAIRDFVRLISTGPGASLTV